MSTYQLFKTIPSPRNVKIARLKDVPFGQLYIRRAGVIMVTKVLDYDSKSGRFIYKLRYCLTQDKRSLEWGDGGGCYEKVDGYSVRTAFRELHQETLGIFDRVVPDVSEFKGRTPPPSIANCLTVYSRSMMIIFIFVADLELHRLEREFRNRLRLVRNPEVVRLKWFAKAELVNLIYGNRVSDDKMYSAVQELLSRARGQTKGVSHLLEDYLR